MKEETASKAPARPTEAALICYHCHDECPDDRLRTDEKVFCCEGCQMVYEILNNNDLCQYYKLDDNPGISLKLRKDSRAYAWLDDEQVATQLIRFSNGQHARVEFLLPQIHCASCIWLLEHLYKLDEGILHSKVNFLKKNVSIHFEPEKTSLRKIASLLANIGYAPHISLSDVDADKKPQAVDRSLIYKIGVAGFAFGNIMLLSFPEYLGLEKSQESRFFSLFGYLNLALSIPVLVYSGKDYFVSAWQGLKHRHLNIDVPLALGMLMLFGRSAWEVLTGSGAGYLDSFAGLVFFLLGGKWFQQKTYHQLAFDRDYKSYFPVAAGRKKSDESEESVPIQNLEPGDIIVIRHGELIPADGILLKGSAQIDYSFVTGEADPVEIDSGGQVFAGGKQLGATIEISLTRRVSTSYLTQLWNDDAFKSQEQGAVSLLADRAGRYFTTLILVVASAAFLYWIPSSTANAINAFTAVLIIACPCAVALSIPFTLGNILRILGSKRFYLKNTHAIEWLAAVQTVVLDKTGTITNISSNAVRFRPAPRQQGLNPREKSAIKSLVRHSNHPRSRQIFESMPEAEIHEISDFAEISGRGLRGRIGDQELAVGSAAFVNHPDPEAPGVFVRIGQTIRGHFDIGKRYREGLDDVLGFFRMQNKDLWLLSGDNDREAAALKTYFDDSERLKFNQSPSDKLRFIKQLREQGRISLMIGDGLNDAGALQQSDVGIVVTENTNNFTPACDAILHAEAFGELPKFLQLAEWGVRTVNLAYLLAAAYNLVGLSFAVSGSLSPVIAAILMPLSSVTIVLFGVGMGHWKALRLGLWQTA